MLAMYSISTTSYKAGFNERLYYGIKQSRYLTSLYQKVFPGFNIEKNWHFDDSKSDSLPSIQIL